MIESAVLLGPFVVVEAAFIWARLCGLGGLRSILIGAACLLSVAPGFLILLIALVAPIKPDLFGGPGTGVGFFIAPLALGAVVVHVLIMLLLGGYLASLRREQEADEAAKRKTPLPG